jgi:predicted nucleotidyltransferase
MSPQVAVDRVRLAEFCRRHHIRRLSFFGSVLGADFRPDSDVDVLVEFEPSRVPGLLTLAGLEIELSELLGRKADVRTAEDLSRYFRDEVVAKAQLMYAAA